MKRQGTFVIGHLTLKSNTQRKGKSATVSQNLRAKLLGGKTTCLNDSDDDAVIVNETPRR